MPQMGQVQAVAVGAVSPPFFPLCWGELGYLESPAWGLGRLTLLPISPCQVVLSKWHTESVRARGPWGIVHLVTSVKLQVMTV